MRSSAARNSPMRRRLNMTVRRATSVGCAVNTGTMSTRLSQSRASSALMPTRRISDKRPSQRAALAAGLAAQPQRNAAALAMVGFSQVDQLEVEGKGAGEQDGALRRAASEPAPARRRRCGRLLRRWPRASASRRRMVPWRSASTSAKSSSPACSRNTSPSSMPSERTSRRSGASFRSPDCASNSASRCGQLSGFHKRAIVF